MKILSKQGLDGPTAIYISRQKNSPIKSFIKKHVWLLVTFLIPATIMFVVYATLQVHPFGKSSVLVLDLNGQYVYFFEALRKCIHGDNSLLYSFSRSLGGEFLGIYAYYLASPLSYIVALFPENMILEALYLMFVIKVGLCSLSFAVYLRCSRKADKGTCIAFSILYALSAYCVVYQHNTMWIDCVILFPLLLLGIERLIDNKGVVLYIVSLACCLLFNFYIGYMCCLFTVIYFFATLFSRKNVSGELRHFSHSFLRIILSSVVGIMISCVIVLPAYVSLTFGKNEFSVPNFDFTSRFDFLDLSSMLYIGSYDSVRPEGLPLIYCGIIVILLAPLYFICKKIPRAQKISNGITAGILIFCMSCNTLDMIWHGFQAPNWLNYRYSFMLSFLLLVFAAEVFENIENIGLKPIIAVSAFALLLLFVMQKLDYENLPDVSAVWLSVLFIGIYILILYLPTHTKKEMCILLLVGAFTIESYGSALLNLISLDEDVVISSYASYHNQVDKYKKTVNDVKEYDSGFYRMENARWRYPAEPFALDYYGIASTTSTLNSDTIDFLYNIGYASRSNWSKYIGANPVNDSLVGIKYIIDAADGNTGKYFDYVLSDEENRVYYNPYALSLAVAVDDLVKDVDFDEYESPFDRMNALVSAMLGREVEIWKPIAFDSSSVVNASSSNVASHYAYERTDSSSKGKVTYYYELSQTGMYYVYLISDYWREVELSFGGYNLETFFGNESWCISKPCFLEATEKTRLIMTFDTDNMYLKEDTYWVYYLDEDLFKEVFTELQNGNFEITDFSETHLSGTITAAEDGTVWTSVPYDDGWHIKLDGVEVEKTELCNALIGFDITQGTHTLEMYYMPSCFVVGLAISISGLFILLAIIVIPKIKKSSNRKKEEIPDTTQSNADV